jgi:predicted neuraminidase
MKKLLLFLICPFCALCQVTMEEQALIFPLQNLHVHGSSIVELPNGDLLAAWFQGSGERTADDVKIMGARRKGKAWSAPFVLADTPGLPDCNPVLFYNHQNQLHLVWIAVQANRWEQSVLRILKSKTSEPDWAWQDNIFLKPGLEFVSEMEQKFKSLPPLHHGWAEYAPKYDELLLAAAKDPAKRSFGWMTRIKPLLLPDNKLLLPLYSDGFNLSLMAISEDDGTTWKPGLPLVGRGPIQPALVQKRDGSIVAFLRDSGDAPNRVHRSESHDQGLSWSASQKTALPSAASVEATKLPDGRWVMVLNDTEGSRYRLSLYLSTDEGATWKKERVIEENQRGSFSYPALIVGKDGHLHLTYSYHLDNKNKSIKYVKIRVGS